MGHPNERLMEEGYKAFAEGDLETIDKLWADDIVWHVSGNSPLSGDYKGKQEVFGFFAKITELSGGTFKLDVHDILANDEHAVALATASATRDGKSFNQKVTHVFHVADGKVTEFWGFPEDSGVADAFWS